jgi:hypothetical protein
MSSNPFQPACNGVAIATSTTSSSAQVATQAPALVLTNRSSSSAWVTWTAAPAPVAAFPSPGDPNGSWGMEMPPMTQLSVSVGYVGAYVAAVLLSGTGVLTIVPGDGL